jgi:hypothetical protein
MHNLFLGTAKRMMEIWIDLSLLTRADLERIQSKVDATNVPSNYGRMPYKIATSFSGFTAEQWKTWVTVFSPFALFGHLPSRHYKCWLNFVKACKLLSKPMIRISEVGTAHSLLIKFCRDVEELYGKERITPNMHMHSHLADCILDYGPVYSFWLFSFERYNGILGNYHTNNRSVELQIMRKFVRDQSIRDFQFPDEFQPHFNDITDHLSHTDRKPDTLVMDNKLCLDILKLSECRVDITNELWFSLNGYDFGSPHVIDSFDNDKLPYIYEVYKIFLPDIPLSSIPLMYDKYASVAFAGERYGSSFSRLNRVAYIVAKWAGRYDGSVNLEALNHRPGMIEYFIRQCISYRGNLYPFCFAYVRWFQYHPEQFHCGNDGVMPEIWCANLFESLGASSFIPVQRLGKKFVAGYEKVKEENVLFAMPLEERVLI